MLIYDFEVFKHDWILCWLDCETRKLHYIVNDKVKLEKFYEYYKNRIMIGYNSRQYDVWIMKAILCDFSAYDMSDWLINKNRKGFEFSNLLNKFPILNYDCVVGFRSLKELEAFMGHDIRETSVPFDIDRPLTQQEILDTIKYCKHDVMETFEVFVETKDMFETQLMVIKEFNLQPSMIDRTQTQLSAEVLGAVKIKRNDEFDIKLPDNMILGKYSWIKDYFYNWAKSRNYEEMTLKTDICGIPHVFGVGGLHGAITKYVGEGYYLMADVASYYPAGMIEYDFLSRNVSNKSKYKTIRDERIILKRNKDKKQEACKLILNKTFGGSKDQYNKLYDPVQANNLCIANQLFLVDLLEKLEGKCELIQTNTDGILVKLYNKEDKDTIINICHEWEKRTRFILEFDEYRKVFQRDVNNYVIIPEGDLYDSKGKERFKRKGAVLKKLSRLDNDLPILNKAVVNYLVHGIKIEDTINNCNKLIEFQKITKISSKYEYGSHNGKILHEKVHRCFASLDKNDGTLYKKHKSKTTLDKTSSTPESCFIINDDVQEMPIPKKLDRQWYINLAYEKAKDFIN